MRKNHKNKGFSLTEVLMAMGILTTAMMFIGGVFPVALHFTKTATERTIAAVVADEAFAKIKLYGINTSDPSFAGGNLVPFEDVSAKPVPDGEFAYPSTGAIGQQQYYWSALCKRLGGPTSKSVQVTVFISRKIGGGQTYWTTQTTSNPLVADLPYPKPIPIAFTWPGGNILSITDRNSADRINEENFVNDGYTIVDSQTGQIYRVDERYTRTQDDPDRDKRIRISGDRLPSSGGEFWVVPSAAKGGRYPCIAVYQKIIRF